MRTTCAPLWGVARKGRAAVSWLSALALVGCSFGLAACGPRPPGSTDGGGGTDSGGGSDSAAMVDCTMAVAAPVTAVMFASGLQTPEGLTFDGVGNLWVGSATTGGMLWQVSTTGVVTPTPRTGLGSTLGLAPAGGGALYAADMNLGGVVEISAAGVVATLGTGVGGPNGVALGPDGAVYATDFNGGRVMRIMAGVANQYVGGVAQANGIAFSTDGNTMYVASYTAGRLFQFDLSTGTPGAQVEVASGLGFADGVALDECGNFYVNNNGAGEVIRIGSTGAPMEVLATGIPGSASVAFGEGPGWAPTDLYVTAAGAGRVVLLSVGVPGVPLVP